MKYMTELSSLEICAGAGGQALGRGQCRLSPLRPDGEQAAELGSRGYRRRRGSRIAAMEPCQELIDRSAKLGHASLSDH